MRVCAPRVAEEDGFILPRVTNDEKKTRGKKPGEARLDVEAPAMLDSPVPPLGRPNLLLSTIALGVPWKAH